MVLNTALVRNTQLITRAAAAFGIQNIVASIDAKLVNGKYKCCVIDGTEKVDMSPVELAKEAEQLGSGEIIINSFDRDGMMQGYDNKLVKVLLIPLEFLLLQLVEQEEACLCIMADLGLY